MIYLDCTIVSRMIAARDEALRLSSEGVRTEPEELRRLDHRARVVLSLFSHADRITTAQVAEALGLSPRMARVLLHAWVDDGRLVIVDPSNRNRAYGLSANHRQFIGKVSAKPDGGKR